MMFKVLKGGLHLSNCLRLRMEISFIYSYLLPLSLPFSVEIGRGKFMIHYNVLTVLRNNDKKLQNRFAVRIG